LKFNQSFETRVGAMHREISVPSKVVSRLIEIVGAGLASALGAFLLGQIAKPAAPPPPVVKIVPADAETIRMVRGDVAYGGPLSTDGTAVPHARTKPFALLPMASFEPSAM
jgi:hypothetical protein